MALPKKNSTKNTDWIETHCNGKKATQYSTLSEAIIATKNLRVDAKRRLALGNFIPDEVSSYDAEIKENGVIILHPKVEIPAEELWLFKNPEALASVRRGFDDLANKRFVELEEDFWDDIEE